MEAPPQSYRVTRAMGMGYQKMLGMGALLHDLIRRISSKRPVLPPNSPGVQWIPIPDTTAMKDYSNLKLLRYGKRADKENIILRYGKRADKENILLRFGKR